MNKFLLARFLIFLMAVSACASPLIAQQTKVEETENPLKAGIALTKPSQGRFVALEDGTFMVPYVANIPGTEITFEMMPIPGGTFSMGSEDPKKPDQGPVFSVAIEPFWMGKHEITWEEFEEFMKLTPFFRKLNSEGVRVVTKETEIDAVTAPSMLYDPQFTYDLGESPKHPAATITQFSAKQYTKWLSLSSQDFYRLPYESEWEYACRGGTKTKWYFGDDASKLKEHAWYLDNSDEERHLVGKLKPNPWGLHDMLGNVCEWTLDQYDQEGYSFIEKQRGSTQQPVLEQQVLPAHRAFNKPSTEYPRCLRGGSWDLSDEECTCFSRLGSDEEWKATEAGIPQSPWWFTDSLGMSAGFRIIRPLKTPSREEQDSFWKADVKEIRSSVRQKVEFSGSGGTALVDEKLVEDLEKYIDPKVRKRRPNP